MDAVNAAGGSAVYLEIENGAHGGMIAPAMPQVLDYFAGLIDRE